MISGRLAVLVAASLIASSSTAIAQSAQPLGLANNAAVARAGADLEDANQLSTIGYVAIGVVLAGVIIFLLVNDDDDEAFPVSP